VIGRITRKSLVPLAPSSDEKKGATRACTFAVTLTSPPPSSLPPGPSRARWALVVALALAVTVLAPAPGRAQDPPTAPPDTPDPAAGDPAAGTTDSTEPPPDAPPPPSALDPSPHVRVLLAHFGIFRAEELLSAERARLDEARLALLAAQQRVGEEEAILANEQATLETARSALREFSVSMFIHANGGAANDPAADPTGFDQLGIYAQRRQKPLTDSVREFRVSRVEEAKDRITAASLELDARRQAADQAAALTSEHESIVADAERGLKDARDELRVAQRDDVLVPFERDPDDEGELHDGDEEADNDARLARDSEPQHQWELLIEGESVFKPEEMAAWFLSRQTTAPLARAPVEDLARFFIEEGTAEGIRGDVAFAQAILETGSFTNDDTVNYNNYAGIGHCDSCPTGWSFPSPQEGVRAQIQLLKSYVYDKPEYMTDLVDRRLRGPAGCCQTWNELSGVWATGGGYSAHIMRIYQEMLEWLYQARTGTPPPPRPDPSPVG
jgi:hypothetical protein